MPYNFLVVDDSKVTRSMVKKTLSMVDLDLGSVHEAGDGREALQVLDSHWVDLVLADLNMPGMDGIELVKRMAQNNLLETVPVVIVSSNRQRKRIEELKKQGVRAYIQKPLRPESLRDVIFEVLGASNGGSHE